MTSEAYRHKANILFAGFIFIALSLSVVNLINAIEPSFSFTPLIPAVLVLPAILSVFYYWIDDTRFMKPMAKLIFRMLNWDVYWNAIMATIYQPHYWYLFAGLAVFYYFINLKAVGCKFLALQKRYY